MTQTVEFDDFVRARSTHLLRLAYVLTRDHGNAEDLLQTALARSWSAWRRIDGDPEPYVRRTMVNAYASWRGRRWHGERPSSALPEVPHPDEHAAVDARDEVGRALARLPRQQRAVLVLRYFEDMSEAQISEAMGISSGAVKSYASRGLAALRTDPSLVVLEPAAGDLPAGLERLAGVHERIRRDRRRRVGAVVVAGLIALALLLGFVLSPLIRARSLPAIGPKTGDYYQGYRIVAVMSRPLTAGPVSTTFTPTGDTTLYFPFCQFWDGGGAYYNAAVVLEVDGVSSGPGFCSRDGHIMLTSTPAWPVGVPVHVTMRLVAEFGGQLPTHGVMAVAFGEPVPFADYPKPPRPAHLEPLPRDDQGLPGALFLDVADPTVTIPGGRVYRVEVRSQTPGDLTTSVSGQPPWMDTFWDYQASAVVRCVDLRGSAGPRTITASARYTTGDWYVAVAPADVDSC